jgi:hypothetical protein
MMSSSSSFEEFVNNVMLRAKCLEPGRKCFYLASLHTSFFNNISVIDAAKEVLNESKHEGGDWQSFG